MTQHELYCGVCNKYTLHSLGLPRLCLVCKAKEKPFYIPKKPYKAWRN